FNKTTINGYTDTLRLKWKGGTNTTKYKVYFGKDSSNLALLKDSVDISNPIFKFTNIETQTTYYWRIEAEGILGTTKGDLWTFKTLYHKGLVGYWSIDEGSDRRELIDSSKFHNKGTLGSNSTRISGYKNKSMSFRSMEDEDFGAKIPDQPQIYFGKSSFSISLWLKADPSMLSEDVYILCKGSIGTDSNLETTGKRYNIEMKEGTLYFALDAGDKGKAGKDQARADATPLFTGEWENLIVIRDTAKQKMKIYINGDLAAEEDINSSKYDRGIGEHNALILGNIGEIELETGAFAPAPFKGGLDEIKIFNYPLSSKLVKKIYKDSAFLAKVSDPSPKIDSVGAGPETVYFSWEEKTGTAISYNFYLGTNKDSLTLVGNGLTKKQFSVDSLIPSTQYYWMVEDSSDAQQIKGDKWGFVSGKDTLPPKVITRDLEV